MGRDTRNPAAVLLQVVYHMHTDMNTLDMHLAPGIAFVPLPVRAPVRVILSVKPRTRLDRVMIRPPYFEVRRDFD
jgi:hypothetical protein